MKNKIKINAYDVRELLDYGRAKFNTAIAYDLSFQYCKKIMKSKANGNIFNVIHCNNIIIEWIKKNTTSFTFLLSEIKSINEEIKNEYFSDDENYFIDNDGKLVDKMVLELRKTQ